VATYRVTRKIAAGALYESYVGVVRQAVDQPVWLRRIVPPWSQDPGFLDRFQPLAEQWRALPTELVAGLVEHGTGADSTWVTQALVDGESVRTLLAALTAKQQRPHMNEAVAIGIRVASALAAIHEQSFNLLHGDLCPSTVQLTVNGTVMLTDFGLATAAGFNPQSGPARAEPQTVAPEQQSGRYLPATDVYRLGLLLLELSTGRATPAASWPGVPEKLATALSWMLAKDPAQRPQARDVENALQHAADASGWSVTENDLQRFLARLLPDRAPRTAIPPTGGTELHLRAVGLSAAPLTPMLTPPGVTLARISTRKVTAEVLAAEKERAAAEAAAKAPPIMPWRDFRVGEALISKLRLTPDQLQEAATHAESIQGSVNDALISMSLCDEDSVIGLESELAKTPVITSQRLIETKPPPEVLGRLRATDAETLNVVPLGVKPGDQLVVALRDPLNAEALEAVKRLSGAASVLGVRAGPAALVRAVAALYRGVDVEDPSSWLENSMEASGTVEARPNDFGDEASGIELDGNVSGSMELESRGTLATGSKSNATLDDPQAVLLDATLALLADKGRQVQQLVSLAGGLTRRLGASESDVGRVRFSAAAIGVVNITNGKSAWEPLRAETVAAVAGTGWRSVQELVVRGLESSKGPASDLAMLALQTALIVANAAASAKPAGQSLSNALQALKMRQFPKLVIDAVTHEVK